MKIKGYCPMGCGQSLYADESTYGIVLCGNSDCPRQFAAHQVLHDGEETGHIVEFMSEEDGYNCKHPLWERLDDQLLKCRIGDRINEVHDMDPDIRGTYRFDGRNWEEVV